MTTTYSPRPARHAVAPAGRRSPAALVLALAWAGAAAVLALWWQDTGAVVGAADWLLGAGRIAGLLSGYCCALLVGLMARVPVLEQGVGSDRVARWHSSLGRYTVCLLAVHITLVLWGYAVQARTGVVGETKTVVLTYPEMLKGTIGGLLLLAVGALSVRAVRRKVRYETWYYLHLLTYLAVFLAFWHQLALGADFSSHPLARGFWYALYGAAAAAVVWFRLAAPLRLNLRHRLRVAQVVQEAPGVVSVIVCGERLPELAARAGQFLRWRFLAPGLRWTASPYSLSTAPRPDLLRITVKAVGGHSAALARLRPGTRIWAEGPYGALTSDRRTRQKVLLLAGGVGVTPLRALFESLPARPGDLTLIYRARSAEDLALRGELEAIARSRGARLHYLLNQADGRSPRLTAEMLRASVPDVAGHDVYLCGPPGMAAASYEALRSAGVPARHIHHESFEL
ncbi:ferredoxin reductase family protein [Streptomyces cocklensis]|jgi:ferredoxin-NADP reductase/DMSO/TMAO reductase YedYZ heme-binding membrane subunit|uniref:Ferredoxin-NADP reductase n=1 Tax=Actinacidiphila cocklensis TaxID=887465 RepID=A0A9W4E963_9ACTN|nr:ferredoxin reductase family protein [Actinacidiphila cocklensis]MDD1063391.1 ferredoxin reductase family protein [Actinacidiphila cocklensis]WSX74852.1 ferredoxin reductase family protein [Streptomyces sp. NBC_00899]CAG6395996.1 Ferredoxin-NADP reductase [Actinacidiphila cocklensis]